MVIKGVSKGIFLQDGFFIFFPRMCFHISLFQDGFSYFFSRMVFHVFLFQDGWWNWRQLEEAGQPDVHVQLPGEHVHVHVQLPGEHVHVHVQLPGEQ